MTMTERAKAVQATAQAIRAECPPGHEAEADRMILEGRSLDEARERFATLTRTVADTSNHELRAMFTGEGPELDPHSHVAQIPDAALVGAFTGE